MEQKLDLLLSKFETMEDKLSGIEKELGELKSDVKEVKGKLDKLDKREQEHFELLFEEYGRVHGELDVRISALEK